MPDGLILYVVATEKQLYELGFERAAPVEYNISTGEFHVGIEGAVEWLFALPSEDTLNKLLAFFNPIALLYSEFISTQNPKTLQLSHYGQIKMMRDVKPTADFVFEKLGVKVTNTTI